MLICQIESIPRASCNQLVVAAWSAVLNIVRLHVDSAKRSARIN